MKKLLVVGVIVLFIGLAIAPSINANISKASIDSELVEITTEVCGLNGGKHTISLSKENVEEVDRLFDSIKEKLDKVETREDTEKIFNEAIVELDKYGLLGGLSVKQAQKLVTGGYQYPIVKRVLERIYNRNLMILDDDENMFCLINGETNNTFFEGRLVRRRIGLGLTHVLWNISVSATGWIHTIGLNGVKDWNGSLQGNLSRSLRVIIFHPAIPSGLYTIYRGVYGFRGIKIGKYTGGSHRIFYMGFASRVKISSEPPEV